MQDGRPVKARRAAVAVCLLLVTTASYAEDESHDQSNLHRHHLGLFAGIGFERAKNGHEEDGTAIGLAYRYRINPSYSIGVDIERLTGGNATHRSSALAVPVSFHAGERWRLFAGPGVEFQDDKKDKLVLRAGVAYEIELAERWSLSPEFMVDFIEGGDTIYLVGLSVGYGF